MPSVENVNIVDHIECTVDTNFIDITPVDTVFTNTTGAEPGNTSTTAETATSAVTSLHPEVVFGSSPSQSCPLEVTTNVNHIMDDIAVL